MSDNLPSFDQADAQPQPTAEPSDAITDDTPFADYPPLPDLPPFDQCSMQHMEHMLQVVVRAMQAFVETDRVELAKDASKKLTALGNEARRRFALFHEQQAAAQAEAVAASQAEANMPPKGTVLQ